MPTPTYTPLANITLGSSAASVTFSSISQAYRDLVLVCNGTFTGTAGFRLTLNGDTDNSTITAVTMIGNGSAASSGTTSGLAGNAISNGVNGGTTDSMYQLHIFDYSVTDKHTSMLLRHDRSDTGTLASASRWANTAAVTTVKVWPASGSWSAGSTFALYGIAS